MGKIRIDVDVVFNMSSTIDLAEKNILNTLNTVRNVRYAAEAKVLSRNNLTAGFVSAEGKLNQLLDDIAAIEKAVESGAGRYRSTEERLVLMGRTKQNIGNNRLNAQEFQMERGMLEGIQKDKLKEAQRVYTEDEMLAINKAIEKDDSELVLSLLGAEVSNEYSEADYLRLFGSAEIARYLIKVADNDGVEAYVGKATVGAESELKSEFESQKLDDKSKDFLKDKGLAEDIIREESYSKDGKSIEEKGAPAFYEKEQTLLEAGVSDKVSVSLLDASAEGGYGKVSATVAEAEAHGGFSAGLYVLGADNTKKFSPGVNAEVGASATALAAEWEKQWLGNEMLGLNTEVEATVGKAETGAEAVAQIFGEDGKLDVQLGAGAKAEAIAGEIEGSIGVNVLGGEVGVGGSVNFGLGAHADVGLRDGVIKCDVGVSVGVGVSANVELDVGGMVNTVVDKASAAWDGFVDTLSSAGDAIGNFFGF